MISLLFLDINYLLVSFQLKVCPKHHCLSTVGVRKDLFPRDPEDVPVTDFFGSLRPVELTKNMVRIETVNENKTVSPETEIKYRYYPRFPDVSVYS